MKLLSLRRVCIVMLSTLIAVLTMALATPLPAEAQGTPTATVTAWRLNLRAGPGTTYQVIGTLTQNQVVTLLGRDSNANWVQVRTNSGATGWASTAYMWSNYPLMSLSVQNGGTPAPNPSPGGGTRWIDVNLSTQTIRAYEGNTVVYSARVSTGRRGYETVTGRYNIWVKLRYDDMTGGSRERGDYYYLEDVPYVMYFYRGYGIHGTYWHNNFGTPMSAGCVNLTIADAQWFYNWASVGTMVNVHY